MTYPNDFKGYYKTLGLNTNATEKEIRTAYLSMVRKYHPDKNKDDPQAAAKFRDIQEAYDILKDPQKRKSYDSGQDINSNGGGGFDFNNMNDMFTSDIFGDIFGQMFGGRRSSSHAKPAMLNVVLSLSLEDAYFGLNTTVKFTRANKCTKCSGTGSGSNNPCHGCGGRGVRTSKQGFFVMSQTCSACNGTGKNICTSCGGAGAISGSHQIEVQIPAGIKEGEVVAVRGEGNYGGGSIYGDLGIQIKLKSHTLFEVLGGDLRIQTHIPFIYSLAGGEIQIPCIDGSKAYIKIPQGTAHGQEFCITGKGLRTGNMYVKVLLEYPNNINSEQVRWIKENLGNLEYRKFKSDMTRFDGYSK